MELAFMGQDQIMGLMELLVQRIFKDTKGAALRGACCARACPGAGRQIACCRVQPLSTPHMLPAWRGRLGE
jgi:hypothetical protein